MSLVEGDILKTCAIFKFVPVFLFVVQDVSHQLSASSSSIYHVCWLPHFSAMTLVPLEPQV